MFLEISTNPMHISDPVPRQTLVLKTYLACFQFLHHIAGNIQTHIDYRPINIVTCIIVSDYDANDAANMKISLSMERKLDWTCLDERPQYWVANVDA